MKQPVNWQAFEGRSGLSKSDPDHMVLFHKWQEDRFILLQRRMQMQFGDIEKEFRRTMFLRAATDSHGANTRITILPWLPKGEYADVLQAGSTAKAVYDAYLSQRNSTPMFSKLYSFYADAAQLVSGRGDQRLAQRILSNLAELDLDDPQPLRMMAFRLEANNQLDAAVGQYRRILVMRPEEPQSHRDLSIALARQANTMMERARGTHVTVAEEDELQGQAIERYTEAIQLLTKVILGKWDARFHQIQITALADLNRLVNFTKFYGLNHLHVR
jgi:tetratricopeptide (TPR) repeat protein